MKRISILGCGWLGLPLAKALIKEEYQIKGSTTTEEKVSKLKRSKIQPYLIVFEKDGVRGDLSSFLEGSQTLVIDIPPKLRKEHSESFVTKIELLIPFIEQSSIENVVFISSTSVYGKTKVDGEVTEKTPLQPDTESGKQLQIVEELLHKNKKFNTTVLRFGGLIGKDRNPVTILVKKENTDAEAPVNLIDQKDCIAIIFEVIVQNCWGETFNAVAPAHPPRAKYYKAKAARMKLPEPIFTSEKTVAHKVISSSRLEHILDYQFQVLKR